MPEDDAGTWSKGRAEASESAWQSFLDPGDGAAFLNGWLSLALDRLRGTSGGVLFLRGEGDSFGIGALRGLDAPTQDTAGALASRIVGRGAAQVEMHPDGGGLAGVPLLSDGRIEAVLVVVVPRADGPEIEALLREMHWVNGWIDARLWQGRAALRNRQAATARLTLELLAAVDEDARFDAAAMALVTALPRLTGFDRAALGMLRGDRVRLDALSGAATFQRRADMVRDIEAAMEEALAQDDAITFPQTEGSTRIDAAHRHLAARLGSGALLTVPLPVRGRAVGALLLEKAREDEAPVMLDRDAVEQARLAAAAVAPVLHLKLDARRWISGRARSLAGRAATAVLGRRPVHTLAALAGVAGVAGLTLVQLPMRIPGEAVLEGREQRAATAPVDGFIAEALVQAGDTVAKGDVLLRLDDRDLRLDLDRAEAATAQAEQAVRNALSGGDRAAAAKARAELEEAQATRDLALVRLARLDITAPTDGLVVSGDLSQRLGGPVTQGEVLFEIARLDDFRLRIDVSEYDLAPIRVGQTGTLVLNALPGQPVDFAVTVIASVSTPGNAENRFRLEATPDRLPPEARPGMQGVARIETGTAPVGWLWFRSTLRRAQLVLWRWWP